MPSPPAICRPRTAGRNRYGSAKETRFDPAIRALSTMEIHSSHASVSIQNPGRVTSPSLNPTREAGLACKRAVDCVCAASLLVLLFVPMVLIGLLVKVTSSGPIFYSQQRVGLHGRLFRIHKFRTMRPNSEVVTGPVWSCENDPRQTWLGAALRRMGIDELPQLWNVLKGQMSLVGPRPERPHFVHTFSQTMANYPQRHQVVPGITGLAQVHGMRGATSIEKRLEYDLQYVVDWSPILDLAILLRTPIEILRGLYAS